MYCICEQHFVPSCNCKTCTFCAYWIFLTSQWRLHVYVSVQWQWLKAGLQLRTTVYLVYVQYVPPPYRGTGGKSYASVLWRIFVNWFTALCWGRGNSWFFQLNFHFSHQSTSPPSSRQHLSNSDCLEDKTEDNQNCSVLYCLCQWYAHTYEQFSKLTVGLGFL